MSSPSKSKKKKFKKIVFKVSQREYDIIEKCAQLDSITLNKFIKRNIRNGVEDMMPRLKTWLDQLQPDNQLTLFDEDEESIDVVQTNMLEEYDEFYNNPPES